MSGNVSNGSPSGISTTATTIMPTHPALSGVRQFDFWLGEWDLSWAEGGKGRNSIQAILGGCVILESFEAQQPPAFQGMSVSIYNDALGKWQQTWVDNNGLYLDLIGTYQDGKMILSRTTTKDGQSFQQRMVFYNISENELDWNWEHSDDQGQTWQCLWHIHYQRRSH